MKEKFQELNPELQTFFLGRLAISVLLCIVALLSMFLVDSSSFVLLLWLLAIAWIGYNTYLFVQTINDKLLQYDGICVEISKPSTSFYTGIIKKNIPLIGRQKHTIYGKSSARIKIEAIIDGQEKTAYFDIPISHAKNISERESVRFYAFPSYIFAKNDNTYTVSSVVLVKTMNSNYD